MGLNDSDLSKTDAQNENNSASKSPNKQNNFFKISKNSPEFRSSTQLKDPLIVRQEKYFLKLSIQNDKLLANEY